jgi:hypothetical protein
MNPKFDAMLKKHKAVLDHTSRELATNFNMPARDIIASACQDMGITRKMYDALISYQIDREQAVQA